MCPWVWFCVFFCDDRLCRGVIFCFCFVSQGVINCWRKVCVANTFICFV